MNGMRERGWAIKLMRRALGRDRGSYRGDVIRLALGALSMAVVVTSLLGHEPLFAFARAASVTHHIGRQPPPPVPAAAGTSEIGTEAEPLVVKVEPTAKLPADVAQEAKDRADKVASDQQAMEVNRQIVTVGRWQLAVFVLQLFVFGYQAYKLQQTVNASAEQSRDMKESINASIRAAVAMEQVATNTTQTAQTAADSVTALRERTAQQMRAYLSVDVGGATYQERDKNLHFEGKPLLRNTGHTPAHGVTFKCRAGILPMPLPEDFTLPPPDRPERGGGVIGPGQTRILGAMIEEFVPDDEVDAIKRGANRALYVWGRVTYQDVFGELRYTNFCQALTWFPNGTVIGYFSDRYNDSN